MQAMNEVQQKLQALKRELNQARTEVEIVLTKIKGLQRECGHPNGKIGFSMGEHDFYCEDCLLSS